MSLNQINENEIISNIIDKQIFDIFKKNNTCIDNFFSDKFNLKRNDIEIFNKIISDCLSNNICIIDILTTFEKYISNYNKIIQLLNKKHYTELRRALLLKYNIKNSRNTLNTIFKVL
jgi:hypothetical protein